MEKHLVRFYLASACLISLVACGGGASSSASSSPSSSSSGSTSESSSSSSSAQSTSSSSSYVAPSPTNVAQFYELRAFPTLFRGMTLYLDDYVGLVKEAGSTSTDTYSAYVLTSDSDLAVGYVSSGTTNIVLSRTGDLVFNVIYGSVVKTYEVWVNESSDMNDFLDVITGVNSNFTATSFRYDDDGNEVVDAKIIRSKNYMYNATTGSGYLLSKKDDNIYPFTLPSVDSEEAELKIGVSPAGDKADFNGTYIDINALAKETYWSYSTFFGGMAQYRRYHYYCVAGSSATKRLFKSVGLMKSSYSLGSTTYYPYLMFASFSEGKIDLLPVLTDSSYSSTVLLDEIHLTDYNTSNVKALVSYVDSYKAPTPIDVSEVVNAFKSTGSLLNYTIETTNAFYGDDGTKLDAKDPLIQAYFERLQYNTTRKITQDAYWGMNFVGATAAVMNASGGLWSKDSKTWHYKENPIGSGSYYVDLEYKQAAQSGQAAVSLPHWWGYTNMQAWVLTLAFDTRNFALAYPTYDEATKTYSFSTALDAGQDLVYSAIKFGYHEYIAAQDPVKSLINGYSTLSVKINYEDDGTTVKDIDMHCYVTFPTSLYPALSQNYTWDLGISVNSIGKTNIDSIINQLSPLE